MAHRAFFSFHYKHDVHRAWQIRNVNKFIDVEDAGFYDEGEYRKAKAGGDAAIRRMIDGHLNRSTVTVVLIGTYTWSRPWVLYEIKESVRLHLGLIGIRIHDLEGPVLGNPYAPWGPSPEGLLPYVPPPGSMPIYSWDPKEGGFAEAIEEAHQRGRLLRAFSPPPKPALPPPPQSYIPRASLTSYCLPLPPAPDPYSTGAIAQALLDAAARKPTPPPSWPPYTLQSLIYRTVADRQANPTAAFVEGALKALLDRK
jgi:hypothetical protein